MAGSVLGGAYAQSQAQAAQNAVNEFNANVEEQNAVLAEQDAKFIMESGKGQVQDLNRAVGEFKGEQRASIGASGVVVDSGSTRDVVLDTAAKGAIDALTLERNTAREARNARIQAANFKNQAELARLGYVSPDRAYYTSLLSGGLSAGSQYVK
jgi:hypothetical protein